MRLPSAPGIRPAPVVRRAVLLRVVRAGLLAALALEALALLLADPQELRWAARVMGWPLPAMHLAIFLVVWMVASLAALLGFLGWLAIGAWRVRTRLR